MARFAAKFCTEPQSQCPKWWHGDPFGAGNGRNFAQSPQGPLGPLGAPWGPMGPKSEPAGDVNFKTFTKICIFGIFGVQNGGFGVQNGGSKLGDRSWGAAFGKHLPRNPTFGISKLGDRSWGAAFGKHLPRNPTFGTHTVSLCGNHTEPAGAGRAGGGRSRQLRPHWCPPTHPRLLSPCWGGK